MRWIAKSLITNNSLYDLEPPMNLIPLSAKDVKLSWVINNCFYVIEYIVGDKEWTADINLPHVGRRGGSIKTRHFGKLEGIDPLLRDKFYKKAEKKGISRVKYLESLIEKEIKDD